MPTPTKAQQQAEATSRAATLGAEHVTAADNADIADLVADSTVPDEIAPATRRAREPDPEPAERKPPTARSPHDQTRNDIVARFRQSRQTEAEEDTDADQINRFTRSGMPPELIPLDPEQAQEQVEPEAVEAVAEEAEPGPVAPVKRKLKVRGQDIELTDEELVAAAQKGLAADSYFEESKNKLKEVDALLRDTRSRATRTAQLATHPGEAEGAQETEAPTPGEAPEHHEDPYAKVVDAIQFGDPKDAAPLLAKLVTDQASKESKETLRLERMRNDSMRSQKVLNDFTGQNPELANDKFASAAIERHIYDLQLEDLRKLGLPEEQLPTTPKEVANWHQHYRVEGHEVRDAATLLTTARDDFMAWRGKSSVSPQPAVREGAPKVTVTVDRQARRAAIQPQPTRTVAPKPDSVTNPPVQRDRSDVVRQMMVDRAKPRRQVLTT